MSFPEEPLNLSEADGLGYFPGNINETLNSGTYRIVRKLGWGSRSSTWLVSREGNGNFAYFATQIFTSSSSKGADVRALPGLYQQITRIPGWSGGHLPNFLTHFWEKSVHGEHLVLVLRPYAMSIAALLQEATENGRHGLPVHAVQKAVSVILDPLATLHKGKVMHGGVTPENVVFTPVTNPQELQEWLNANPPSVTVTIDGLPAVQSQPLIDSSDKPEWDDDMEDVSLWKLRLGGFGHAQSLPYRLEVNHDYSSAPETLLGHATCGLETDIWMLGCLVFRLLTGRQLVKPAGSASERLGEIRDVLDGHFPDAWRDDGHISSLPPVNPSTQTMHQSLEDSLSPEEVPIVSSFLRKCLAIDPTSRASAEDLLGDPWVAEGGKCSCCC